MVLLMKMGTPKEIYKKSVYLILNPLCINYDDIVSHIKFQVSHLGFYYCKVLNDGSYYVYIYLYEVKYMYILIQYGVYVIVR